MKTPSQDEREAEGALEEVSLAPRQLNFRGSGAFLEGVEELSKELPLKPSQLARFCAEVGLVALGQLDPEKTSWPAGIPAFVREHWEGLKAERARAAAATAAAEAAEKVEVGG